MISSGVKVLVIASISSESGAAVAAKAKAQGIPVIDYDRLNLGGTSDYYVSFDNTKVGELQGQGLVQGARAPSRARRSSRSRARRPTTTPPCSTTAQQQVLEPQVRLRRVQAGGQKQAIENWDNQIGGTTFEQILTSNGGKVDGVLAANDGLAGAIITVLTKNGLNGKVIVTGQDATPDGLQAILRGDQYMTVYKPIKQEADATAKLAAALAKGDTAAADALATDTEKDPTGNRDGQVGAARAAADHQGQRQDGDRRRPGQGRGGLRGRPGQPPAASSASSRPDPGRECVAVLEHRLRTPRLPEVHP